MARILVLYYSVGGSVRRMAELLAEGVERVPGAEAVLRTVPKVSTGVGATAAIPETGSPYAELKDLEDCAGLALGSPTRFGNMAAPLKHFLDGTSLLWQRGALAGKPACVFTSTASLHGGQETTLTALYQSVYHFGGIVVAPGYTDPSKFVDGNPYGVSHVSGPSNDAPFTDVDFTALDHLAHRVVITAGKLARPLGRTLGGIAVS